MNPTHLIVALCIAVLLVVASHRPPPSIESAWHQAAPLVKVVQAAGGTSPSAAPAQADLWPGATPCSTYHDGAFDFCAPLGAPVHNPASCTFLTQGTYDDQPRFGAYSMCDAHGLEIYIGHMDRTRIQHFAPGDSIAAGQLLGVIGPHFITTHVHVQLRRNGVLVPESAWQHAWETR